MDSNYTRELARSILLGFTETLMRTDKPRLFALIKALDQRIRGIGPSIHDDTVEMLSRLKSRLRSKANNIGSTSAGEVPDESFPIVNEGSDIPAAGIDFDLPVKQMANVTKSLLDCVRRLHLNTGHPPNAELERCKAGWWL